MFLAATLKYHPGDIEIKTRTDSHAREERMDFNSVKPPHTHTDRMAIKTKYSYTQHGYTSHTSHREKLPHHTGGKKLPHHTGGKKLPHHTGGTKLGVEGHTAHDSMSQQTVTVTWLGIILKTIKQSKKTTDTKLVSLKSA